MTPDEKLMLDRAIEAAGGDYGRGLAALQRRLMQTQLEKGYTTVAAQRRCCIAWPGIFQADELRRTAVDG